MWQNESLRINKVFRRRCGELLYSRASYGRSRPIQLAWFKDDRGLYVLYHGSKHFLFSLIYIFLSQIQTRLWTERFLFDCHFWIPPVCVSSNRMQAASRLDSCWVAVALPWRWPAMPAIKVFPKVQQERSRSSKVKGGFWEVLLHIRSLQVSH